MHQYIFDWLQNSLNFDYFQVDVMVPATSSTPHNKADCSKYIICQDQMEKLMCVKTEDCGLNTSLKKWYTVLEYV